MKSLRVAFVLSLSALLPAQQMRALKIGIVEGDGSQNLAGSGRGAPIVVEVRDDHGRIVPAARVQIQFPPEGPSGQIEGKFTAVSWTDTDGRAHFSGFIPNEEIGEFKILVSASAMGRSARTAFREINVDRETEETRAHKVSHKGRNRAIVGAIAGGAALAAVLVLTLGSGPAVAAAVGSVSVGAPK